MMTERLGFTVRAAVTTFASLVLAHNLIFIAGYGSRFGSVLVHTGHDHGWTVGTAMPGLSVLASAAYPNAVAIILAVALGISMVAALLGWRSSVLIARIQAARSAGPAAAPLSLRRDEPIDRRRGSILGRRLAGRAPPLTLAS
jgi:hypothetical protein